MSELDQLDYQASRLTEQQVTLMYKFRAKLWSLDPSEFPTLLEQEGLPPGLVSKKEIQIAWMTKNMPSGSVEARRQAIDDATRGLEVALEEHQIGSSFMLFGSAALGNVNQPFSDLDMLAIVKPEQSEFNRIRRMLQENFVISEAMAPATDIAELTVNPQGLARVYAVTRTGVEAEFHMLGQQDAQSLHTLSPGYIRRVRPVAPKPERLSGFAGGSVSVLKPSDRVPNYYRQEGRYFRGFFPEAILFGRILHDPDGKMGVVLQNIWEANLKAFLYHNNLIHSNGRLTVDRSTFGFEDFLRTCSSIEDQQISPEFYSVIENRFTTSLENLRARLGLWFT